MIKILSQTAICMCPHGGQLQFMPNHMKADGMDGQTLTIQDYTNAMIVGCAMPPPPAGVSPCLKVMLAIDPMGQAMKVNGNQVVTQMVVSFTDKGWPIMVINPGMSAMSINIDPSLPSFRKAEFAQGAVQKKSGLPIGAGSKKDSSLKPFKDVIMAYWGSAYARRGEKLILKGKTVGFDDGTPATLLVYKYDLGGNHKFEKQLTGSVKKNEVEVTWQFDYTEDVSKLPDKVAGDEFYTAPEYFFELKVGGKSAQSGLIEFRDYIEFELADEDDKVFPHAGYTAYFADGSSLRGILDEEGVAKLKDIPPGNVHFAFSKIFEEKKIISADWDSPYVMRDEIVKLKGQTSGFADGTPATFRILEHDQIGGDDPIEVLTGEIKDDHVEVEWKVKYIKDVDDLKSVPVGDPSYFSPEYYFQLEVQGRLVKSKIVEFRDWLEMALRDEEGKSIPNVPFVAHFADGSQEEGMVDENGKITLKNVPAGKVYFDFTSHIRKKPQAALPLTPSPVSNSKQEKEVLLVVGTEEHDITRGNKLRFPAQAVREVRQHYSSEKYLTVLMFERGYTKDEMSEVERSVTSYNSAARFLRVNSIDDVITHINTRDAQPRDKANANNEIILIKKVIVFSHGFPSRITFGLRKGNDSDVKMELNKDHVSKLSTAAFSEDATFHSYACRTGNADSSLMGSEESSLEKAKPKESLAQKIADHLDIEVHAYLVRSDYKDTWNDAGDKGFQKSYTELEDKSVGGVRVWDWNEALWNPQGAYKGVSGGPSPSGLPKNMFIFKKGKEPEAAQE